MMKVFSITLIAVAQMALGDITFRELNPDNNHFSARNGHATAIFKDRLWLTGGRSASYQSYDLVSTYENADVWYSYDGATWVQVDDLQGDFVIQNSDLDQISENENFRRGSKVAPWYGRFGHSLTVLNTGNTTRTRRGGSDDSYSDVDIGYISPLAGDEPLPSVSLTGDVMVLMGGFGPDARNDVWITKDGVRWDYIGLAPWSPRAYHGAAAVNNGTGVVVVGGTPLSNDVWLGDDFIQDGTGRWSMSWTLLAGGSTEKEGEDLVRHAMERRRESIEARAIIDRAKSAGPLPSVTRTSSSSAVYATASAYVNVGPIRHPLPLSPFSPRAGAQVLTHVMNASVANSFGLRFAVNASSINVTLDTLFATPGGTYGPGSGRYRLAEETGEYVQVLVLLGGYGAFSESDSRFDGQRCRNDIWVSLDGILWREVTANAPWAARAWFSAKSWHSLNDTRIDVILPYQAPFGGVDGSGGTVPYFNLYSLQSTTPRIWLAGGGYMGKRGNRDTRSMAAYVDMWYSQNLVEWTKVNFEEGSGDNLNTSMDWALTAVDQDELYIGKWGHTMEVFLPNLLLDDTNIADDDAIVEAATENSASASASSSSSSSSSSTAGDDDVTDDDGTGSTTSSTSSSDTLYGPRAPYIDSLRTKLYFIGGDAADDGSLSSTVYRSKTVIFCMKDGEICSGRGTCESGECTCSEQYLGIFCETINPDFFDAATPSPLYALYSLPTLPSVLLLHLQSSPLTVLWWSLGLVGTGSMMAHYTLF